mmetsp:Transcript_126234/g.327731  ORF Transcript_126234/g.327731 Transcript_126234/m.327731 type:complete len:204 (-) Transcript_126234:199-810(-)
MEVRAGDAGSGGATSEDSIATRCGKGEAQLVALSVESQHSSSSSSSSSPSSCSIPCSLTSSQPAVLSDLLRVLFDLGGGSALQVVTTTSRDCITISPKPCKTVPTHCVASANPEHLASRFSIGEEAPRFQSTHSSGGGGCSPLRRCISSDLSMGDTPAKPGGEDATGIGNEDASQPREHELSTPRALTRQRNLLMCSSKSTES